ncbi:MAG: TRAM domain-containing protein, partial [Planctomycetota bacterium]
YLRLVEEARDLVPGVEFTSDFIVGFPGETETDFHDTVSLVKSVGFQNIFAFQYSPRSQTPALSLPDTVPPDEKRRRNHVLLQAQEETAERMQRAIIGQEVEVLVEGRSKKDASRWMGRTQGNRIVVFPVQEENLAGRLVQVRVETATPLTLMGSRVTKGPEVNTMRRA